MILAAGKGERMGDLTQTCPKPLLMVRDQPLIVYHLKKLAAIGIKDCVINVRYLGEKIQQVLGDGRQFGINIHYSVETEALETAGGMIQTLDFFENKPFILISADVFSDYPFEKLLAQIPALESGRVLGHLVMVDNPPHYPQGNFSLTPSTLLSLDGPKLNYAGIGIYHPQLVENYPPGYRKIGDVMQESISKQQMTGEHFHGNWLNVDTPQRLELAQSIFI